MLVQVVKKIESRGAVDIAKRALQTCGQIFRYAVAHGYTDRNPAADIKPADVIQSRQTTPGSPRRNCPTCCAKMAVYDGSPHTPPHSTETRNMSRLA
jgi:hypothetical protein